MSFPELQVGQFLDEATAFSNLINEHEFEQYLK